MRRSSGGSGRCRSAKKKKSTPKLEGEMTL
jgi:hypothetical protein